jgi:hypothetical protein
VKLTADELALAKRAAVKYLRDKAPGLSDEDRELLRRYPRHTLEQAREIFDCMSPTSGGGFTDGFTKIRLQEYGHKLGGEHT